METLSSIVFQLGGVVRAVFGLINAIVFAERRDIFKSF